MSSPYSSDVAIVGMAGRFPGARNVGELWTLLRNGEEAIRELTVEELEASGVPRRDYESPSYVRLASVLEGFDLFDAGFFGMSPREAELTDPQHRVFLEIVWEALESAGVDLDAYRGSVGVFAGASASTYLLFQVRPGQDVYGAPGYFPLMIGNDKDYVATRVSYRLNLRGPSVTVQTACSTSLVAVHMACQSLLAGECDLALAGGVAISVPHHVGHWFEEGAYFSPDGRCRAFDANARGTMFGNGAGVVALKRLSDALVDGDAIDAVIKGSAINNDGGAKVGFTAPSARGQAEVIAQALAVAGVDADTIGYVEAHGTGTALGDPIEVAALTRVFSAQTGRRQYCALGSVKTNMGHLDSAAGVAGLIKTVLCLQHRQLVPSLHFREPNPAIDFAASPFYVNTTLRAWEAPAGRPRRAGVSSFGIGGTNAHVVLEEAPESVGVRAPLDATVGASSLGATHGRRAPAEAGESDPATPRWHAGSSTSDPGTTHARGALAEAQPASACARAEQAWLLPLSARSAEALHAQRPQWDDYLAGTRDAAADIGYTAACRRTHHAHRLAVVGSDRDAWRAALAQAKGRVAEKDLRVCWVFAGQGPQSGTMGAELWRDEPVFREAVTAATRALTAAGWTRAIGRRPSAVGGWPPAVAHARQQPPGERSADRLSNGEPSDACAECSAAIAQLFAQPLTDDEQDAPEIVQPALFALQWGLAALWRSWGIVPAAVVGHSLGEVAAACVAEILTLDEGARIVVERSRLLATRRGRGAMVAVALGAAEVERRLAQWAATSANAANSVARAKADTHVPALPREFTCREPLSTAANGPTPVSPADCRVPSAARRMPIADRRVLTAEGRRPTPDGPDEGVPARGTAGLVIAAENSPTSCVVAGERAAIEAWIPTLDADGVRYHRLRTSGVAGHSACVAGLDDALAARLADLRPRRGTGAGRPEGRRLPVPYLSTVDGREIEGEALDARYWGRNLREPVRFADAIGDALTRGLTAYLELSAHPVLTLAISECAGERRAVVVGSVKRDEPERSALLESAGRLWEAGAPLDWPALYGARGRVVRLPPYPWQRRRYWIEKPAVEQARALRRLSCSFDPNIELFETDVSLAAWPALAGHRVDGMCVVPSSFYLALAIDAAREMLGHGALLLTDIVFRAALFFDDRERRTLQLVATRSADTIRMELRSRSTGRDAPWTLHSMLFAQRSERRAPAQWTPARGSARAACDADPRVEPATRFYSTLERTGIELAGSFRLLHTVDGHEGAALCKVVTSAPPASAVESLDLLNQALAAAMLRDDVPEHSDPAMPVRIDEVWVSVDADVRRPALAAAIAASDRSGSVTLYAESGEPLAGANGLRARSLTSHRTWHRVAWVPQPAPDLALDRETTWIVLGGSDVLASEIAGGLRERGCRTVVSAATVVELRALFEQAAAGAPGCEEAAWEHAGGGPAVSETWKDAAGGQAAGDVLVSTAASETDAPREHVLFATGLLDRLDSRQLSQLFPGQDGSPREAGPSQHCRPARPCMVDGLRQGLAGSVGVVSCLALETADAAEHCTDAAQIVQALGTIPHVRSRLWIVTRGARAVQAGDMTREGAGQGALNGLVKVIALEHPELRPVQIDVEPGAPSQVTQVIAELAASGDEDIVVLRARCAARSPDATRPAQIDVERGAASQAIAKLTAPGDEDIIASRARPVATSAEGATERVRSVEHCDRAMASGASSRRASTGSAGSERLVARLERFVPQTTRPFRIDRERSILITGGLGGLALELASWLADEGCRHLVLLGRSPLTVEQRRAIEAIEQRGTCVRAYRADVSRRADVQPILDAAGRQWPPLQGVFHLAGHLEDRTLQRIDHATFARVLAPKAGGAWLLHELTLDRPLDWFVLFSSAGAMMGSAGQASHAAASAALDAVAQYRRSLGLPALSIAWGPWDRAGKAFAQGRVRELERVGIEPLEPAEALESMEQLLAGEETQAGVFRFDIGRVARLYPEAVRSPFLERLRGRLVTSNATLPHALRDVADETSRCRALEAHIREQAALVLRIDPESIVADEPFSGYGMDSLRALEFRNVLEDTLGMRLPAALVWRYPTVRLLSAGLSPIVTSDAGAPALAGHSGNSRGDQEDLGDLVRNRSRSARDAGRQVEDAVTTETGPRTTNTGLFLS